MKDFKRTDLLFSLCGLNCGLCTMRLDNYCPGCGGGEGNQSCRIAKCSLEHGGIEYCSQCPKFPCAEYERIDEFDSFITHINRRRDMEKNRNIGSEAYRAEQKEKAEILEFLLKTYNDGRRKSFFCLAVNLLEPEELKQIKSQLQTDEALAGRPLKEQSAYVVQLLRAAAEQRNIVLKLRRKPSGKKGKKTEPVERPAETVRCEWCLGNDKMEKYHDEEWGIPLHDDRKQFEFLMMEVMQCGLSWNMMIQKREIFRSCFDGFDFEKVAEYGEKEIADILAYEGMIRSRRKIEAVIHDARCFRKIREEYGTFSEYLWGFSKGKTILYTGHQKGNIPAKNGLSDIISKDLKKRGFKYLGSITVYSHLQACGIINDHVETCFRYQDILQNYPVVRKRADCEK